MIIVFSFGYLDLITNIQTAVVGVIDNEDEIGSKIKESQTIVNAYDATNRYGLVLAQRDLINKKNRSSYEAMVLPYLVKFLPREDEQKNYFVPTTNSFVYTTFAQDKTDKILAELALNYLKTNSRSAIVSAYNNIPKPKIVYLDDEEYVPFMQKKDKEADDKYIKLLEDGFAESVSSVNRCDIDKINNEKLVMAQEQDYSLKCIQRVNQTDCQDFKNSIEKNKKINADNEIICLNNRNVASQWETDLKNAQEEIKNPKVNLLENNKNELSNGMYFPDSQSIYMRVIENQDS